MSAQYTSLAFGGRCREAGVRPSMGSVGDAYDNAMCESFFATLECELLDRECFQTQADARILDIFSRYVVGWMVAHPESAALAERLITATCETQGIRPGHLTVHAERGTR